MTDIVRHILSTADVTAMAREVVEAYRLTVSLERDMAEIDAAFRVAMTDLEHLHEQIMFGLEKGFQERETNLKIIHGYIALMISEGKHEAAHEVVTHLMKLLETSPTDRAIQQRATRRRTDAS